MDPIAELLEYWKSHLCILFNLHLPNDYGVFDLNLKYLMSLTMIFKEVM